MSNMINGFPTIVYSEFSENIIIGTRGGRVVILDKGANHFLQGHYHRFVTAIQFHTNGIYDDVWFSGHYTNDFNEALSVFNKQVEQNVRANISQPLHVMAMKIYLN